MPSIEELKYQGNTPFLGRVEMDKNLRPGGHCGPIVRDCYVLECNEGGYGSVVINGREFPFGPRTCYILLRGDSVIHKTATVDPRYGIFAMFGGKVVGEALAAAGITSESPFLPPECYDEIRAILYKMRELGSSRDMGSEYKRTGLLYEILGVLVGDRASIYTKTHIRRAIAIFEASYHTDVLVTEVAAEVGFDRSYFSTLFKEQTGTTPHAYLTSLRIEKSKALLRETDYSIAECAACVGLDPVNFSRIFKRVVGVCPQEYRNAK